MWLLTLRDLQYRRVRVLVVVALASVVMALLFLMTGLVNQFNHEPTRRRKLLLHRQEIGKLAKLSDQKGMTLLPLSVYLKGGKIKIEIGVGRGKKQYEKRESKKEADAKREMAQAMRRNR